MKRITSQEIGDIGEATTLFIASKNRNWIARKLDKDFGIDIEMELVENKVVTGHYVKVQVKGMDTYKVINGNVRYRLKNAFLKYCNECRIPIVLVLIDIHTNIGYFIWIQEYLRIHNLDLLKNKSNYIYVPISNDFADGLNRKIKNIAQRLNYTQLQLDLKASLESAFLIGDVEIYEKLIELSLGIAKTNALEINKIIKDLIVLGNNARGSDEGNKKANMLYQFCRKFGDKFSIINIEEMVVRGDSYSRVGILALSVLYDHFPDYVKSLNLVSRFDSHPDIRISYYCRFREQYIGENSSSLILKKDVNYKIGKLDIEEKEKEILFPKWCNRGDSAILDYLTYRE